MGNGARPVVLDSAQTDVAFKGLKVGFAYAVAPTSTTWSARIWVVALRGWDDSRTRCCNHDTKPSIFISDLRKLQSLHRTYQAQL